MPQPWLTTLQAFLVETYLRGGSRRTTDEYARILSRFLAGTADPGQVDPMAVRAFVCAPVDGGAPPAPSTVGVRLAAISGFYRLAEQSGLVAANPVAGIRRPRQASPAPEIAAFDRDWAAESDGAVAGTAPVSAATQADQAGIESPVPSQRHS